MPTTLQARERKASRKKPDMKAMDKAWESSHIIAPKFSMRAKTSFGAQVGGNFWRFGSTEENTYPQSRTIFDSHTRNRGNLWTIRTYRFA